MGGGSVWQCRSFLQGRVGGNDEIVSGGGAAFRLQIPSLDRGTVHHHVIDPASRKWLVSFDMVMINFLRTRITRRVVDRQRGINDRLPTRRSRNRVGRVFHPPGRVFYPAPRTSVCVHRLRACRDASLSRRPMRRVRYPPRRVEHPPYPAARRSVRARNAHPQRKAGACAPANLSL